MKHLPVTSHTAPSTTSPVKMLQIISCGSKLRYSNLRESFVWDKSFNGRIQALLKSDWRITSMRSLYPISFILLLSTGYSHILRLDSCYSPAHLHLCMVCSKCFLYNCNLHQSRSSSQHGCPKYERLEGEIFRWELGGRWPAWESLKQYKLR